MADRHKTARLVLGAILGAALTACSSDGMDDLREFVANAHKGRVPKVEPLPEIKTQEPFDYTAATLTDPFASLNLRAPPGQAAGGGPRPDLNRRREPLEEYPLDALKLVGMLARGTEAWAVIQAPDGTVHRAGVGNHLGQNFGTITRVSEEKVDLVELIQGGLGEWVERRASMALAE